MTNTASTWDIMFNPRTPTSSAVNPDASSSEMHRDYPNMNREKSLWLSKSSSHMLLFKWTLFFV
jgi:hypothetical protein